MTDRGILFSAPMVRVLLAGTKTQTRRLLAMRSDSWAAPDAPNNATWGPDNGFKPSKRAGQTWALHSPYLGGSRLLHGVCKVPYAVGDRLYVREAWSHTGDHVFEISQARMLGRYGVIYQADKNPKWPHAKFWPSIHMPREFSRLTLTVTDVRVQRLQEISDEDALAEGVASVSGEYRDEYTGRWHSCTVAEYRALWNSLHTAEGERWQDNPWVVAISFDVRKGNIDG